jgi:methylated-DNA-protein-cysteine methyltransferase-like protein
MTGRARPRAPQNFATRVLVIVSKIPHGRVATYGDVARMAGRPRSARAVGRILAAASRPGLPYHRVVAAAGRLGGYGGYGVLKASLLAAEGITVRRGRILEFDERRWVHAGPQRSAPADPSNDGE